MCWECKAPDAWLFLFLFYFRVSPCRPPYVLSLSRPWLLLLLLLTLSLFAFLFTLSVRSFITAGTRTFLMLLFSLLGPLCTTTFFSCVMLRHALIMLFACACCLVWFCHPRCLPATIVTSAKSPEPRLYIHPETHCRHLAGGANFSIGRAYNQRNPNTPGSPWLSLIASNRFKSSLAWEQRYMSLCGFTTTNPLLVFLDWWMESFWNNHWLHQRVHPMLISAL